MSVFDDEAKRLRREAEIESAERAIVDAADKWRTHIEFMSHARSDEETALETAVDAWRKLKGKG